MTAETVRVEYRLNGGVDGKHCIAVIFRASGVILRLPLSDAEHLAEAIIMSVRKAEERAKSCST